MWGHRDRSSHGRFPRALLGLIVALHLAPTAPAWAGGAEKRIAELGAIAASSASDKERLGAVTALARLSDRRTLKPLVASLGDPSELVRAVAAAALGKLGHKASLPALRVAVEDASETVRKRARAAYAKVCKANDLPIDLPAASGAVATLPPPPVGGPGRAGFGQSPRAVTARPDLYVVVETSTDDSPGKADKRARTAHADHLRKAMIAALRGDGSVTSAGGDARRYGLAARHLDLSVTKLEHRTVEGIVEIEAQLRLSISDDAGRMLSFVSGGAVVNVARRTFETKQLPRLRQEALESAVGGLFDKLVAQLRRGPRS